jgi:dUTP pyrophosphatase
MRVKRLHPDAKLPTRADDGSNGYDLYASESVFIPHGATMIVSTGIAIELQNRWNTEQQQVFKIEDRSSMAVKGLRTGGGIVDNSYRGEIKVILHNFSNKDKIGTISPDRSGFGYYVNQGDKIAQGLIYDTYAEEIIETYNLSDSSRGDQGFGSSGK